MPLLTGLTLGAGAFQGISKLIGSRRQSRMASNIRGSLVDPGIRRNQGLIDSGNILGDRLSNFSLPGFSAYLDDIRTGSASALRSATTGATSSADLLGSISAIQGNENTAIQNLYTTQAGARDQALQQYLSNLEAQGADDVRVNQMELQRYQSGLEEAAALEGASNQNRFSAFDDIISGFTPLVQGLSPRSIVNQNTGEIEQMPSIFSQYFKRNK